MLLAAADLLVRMAGGVCPRSGLFLLLLHSSFPKVLAVQRRNVCAQVGGGDRLSFSDFWSFGADDQGRSVAVAWAALSGDLERLKDIYESDDFSIFIQRPGVEEADLRDVLFSNTGLFVSTWS